jgi:NTE family protein
MQKVLLYRIAFLLILILQFELVFTQQQEQARPKIGIVLSGGGAKGLAHIGALKVIEKAGLPVDYIGGTSMGGIIGGLYAIGYNASVLEKIALSQDWNRLIYDNIYRRNLSIEEKTEDDLFFVSFPTHESKVVLPSGIIAGQNIENAFNNLCAHVYNISDFNQFQIPYLCVAFDIVTGKEIVFRSGYLPEALRSTMAIPTVFEPVQKDSMVLVDGGAVNNFPANHVRDMGADIIIGINTEFYNPDKEKKNDLFQILKQTAHWSYGSITHSNNELCDILIKPDMTGLKISSFNETDSIIARGEKAAMAFFPRLKALADSLDEIYDFIPVNPSFNPPDSFLLKEIKISGLKKVSEKLLTGKLQLEVPSKVTSDNISRAINNAYSSLYFEKITYEIQEADENLPGSGIRLNIKVKEREGGLIRVGLNYNSDFNASIILNATFRNLLLNGSRLSMTFGLGESPRLLISYFKNNGWKPGFGLDLEINNYDIFLYEGSHKVSTLDFTDYASRLYTQSIFNNSFSLGLGAEFEKIYIKPIVSDVLDENQSDQYYNAYGFIHLDTYDDMYYPETGSRFNALYKLIYNSTISPTHFFTFRYEQAVKLSKKFTVIPSLYGGITTADSATTSYHFYLGSLNQYDRKGLMSFTGLNFMQVCTRNIAAAGLNVQYNFWKKNYLVFRVNAGMTSWDLNDLIEEDNRILGFGISIGNNSPIGPIEVTFMGSNFHKEPLAYINIGYWF